MAACQVCFLFTIFLHLCTRLCHMRSLHVAPRPLCKCITQLRLLGNCRATARIIGKDHAGKQVPAPCLYICLHVLVFFAVRMHL